MTHAAIIKGKLAIVTEGGSVIPLGIKGFRIALAQIENSKREIKPSTTAMLDVYRQGVAMWANRA